MVWLPPLTYTVTLFLCRVELLETTCAQLKRENEELQRELSRRCSGLEDMLGHVTSERNALKEDLELVRRDLKAYDNMCLLFGLFLFKPIKLNLHFKIGMYSVKLF